jgi:hypothetical protein
MSEYLSVGAVALYEDSKMHGDLVRATRGLLVRDVPAQVLADETVVTGEGPTVCILIIPHHWLGGTSLVLWSDAARVRILWALITSLSTHDDIDLGCMIDVVDRAGDRWLEDCLERVEAEFSRQVEVNGGFVREEENPVQVRFSLHINDKYVKLGARHLRSGLGRHNLRWEIEQTSLAAPRPPKIGVPVPTGEWLRFA